MGTGLRGLFESTVFACGALWPKRNRVMEKAASRGQQRGSQQNVLGAKAPRREPTELLAEDR